MTPAPTPPKDAVKLRKLRLENRRLRNALKRLNRSLSGYFGAVDWKDAHPCDHAMKRASEHADRVLATRAES